MTLEDKARQTLTECGCSLQPKQPWRRRKSRLGHVTSIRQENMSKPGNTTIASMAPQLFDEYTPHDVALHINSLSRIADELLGDAIDNLNAIEASILACALYGHDWRMAVSEHEKSVIVTGKTVSGNTEHDFALITNEHELWKEFGKQNGVHVSGDGYAASHTEVVKPIWREYVRNTHAERSRVRCMKFFAEGLSHFGSAVGEVCAGHWYYIDEIRRVDSNASIGCKSVNLQSLAVYMCFNRLTTGGILNAFT